MMEPQIVTMNIPIDLSQLTASSFKGLFVKLEPVIKKIQNHLLQRAQVNAPNDQTNQLRNSLYVKPVVSDKSITFECGSTLSSSLKIHEEPYKTDRGYQSTQEGGVGNKYFIRVIDYWMSTYADWISEAIIKFLEEDFIGKI